MESLETNKAFAAVLLAGMAFVGAGLIANALVRPHHLAETAIKIDIPEGAAGGGAPAGPVVPFPELLASADPARGEAQVKAQGCVACHSFNQGGKAGVGPNLYNVIGAPHGHQEGYAYSAALKGKAGPWDFEQMNEWLLKPSSYAPGTKMSYAGLADGKKRADIVAYLNSLSPNPKPLPAVEPAAAAAPAKDGAGASPSPAAQGATPGVGGPSSLAAGAPATAKPDQPAPANAPSGVPEPKPQ